MSAVIAFPLERTRPATRSAVSGPAQVIIFPGVRVERLMYDLAERLPAARSGAAAQALRDEFEFY